MSDPTGEALTWADVLALVTRLDESGLADAEVTTGGVSVRVSRHALDTSTTSVAVQPSAAPPVTAPVTSTAAPPQPPTATDADRPDGPQVAATMLGVLYLRPAPDADPFVRVGDVVAADTTVAVIEVMKMMNTVVAGVAGRVTEICRPEGQMVEHGDVLFRLAAEG